MLDTQANTGPRKCPIPATTVENSQVVIRLFRFVAAPLLSASTISGEVLRAIQGGSTVAKSATQLLGPQVGDPAMLTFPVIHVCAVRANSPRCFCRTKGSWEMVGCAVDINHGHLRVGLTVLARHGNKGPGMTRATDKSLAREHRNCSQSLATYFPRRG